MKYLSPHKLFLLSIIWKFIPLTSFFKFKASCLRWAGAEIGENVRISSSVTVMGNGRLIIGNNTWIGHQCLIICTDEIVIGSNCDVAPCVFIGTGTHVMDKSSPNVAGKGISIPIKINDGCWLCARSTILPGATIGTKSVIAAGSVVKGHVPPNELWGGIIARKIRQL